MSDKELAEILWNYMRMETPLKKADIILGLGSHDLRTADWCAKLWHDGWAPTIVFSGGFGRLSEENATLPEAVLYKNRALELGVPAEAILVEDQSTNTGQNITMTYELLRASGLQVDSLIVVTKPYMLRRAYATLIKQWPGTPVPEVMTSAIEGSLTDYGKEEPFEKTVTIMVSDLQRIREYPALGYQIPQDIPDDVWTAYEELVQGGYTSQML